MTTMERILTCAAAGAGGIAIGAIVVDALYKKNIGSKVEEKAKEFLTEEASKEMFKSIATESVQKMSSETINKAVETAAEVVVEKTAHKVVKERVNEMGNDYFTTKVENEIDDYDFKKSLARAVSEAAESYVENKGDGIIRNTVAKSVESKISTLGSIARTAAAFKGI